MFINILLRSIDLQDCTDVTRTEQEPILVLSTLNGDLLAM